MSEPSSGASELDARLAEIDRRLRSIQAELVPERERAEVAAATGSGPDPPVVEPPVVDPPTAAVEPAVVESAVVGPPVFEPDDPIRALAALTELQERLLGSIRELLSAYETVFARLRQVGPEATVHEFTVSAGPFTTTGALREFEQRLSGISGVREVTVRSYEGEDRAIVDVRLGEAKS